MRKVLLKEDLLVGVMVFETAQLMVLVKDV